MSGPSSSPRGERAPKPGARWSTEVGQPGEAFDEDPAAWADTDDYPPPPPANRATRRAARRKR